MATRLRRRGYRVIETNARFGPLELDLVAERGGLLVFCEVRTRRASSPIDPLFTFSETKIRRVRTAALRYVVERNPSFEVVRFDAAAVLVDLSRRRASVRYRAAAF